jgi:acyl carrier protein
MDKEQFLLELEEVFELDEGEIAPEMKLDEVLDSLAILLIIELFEINFSKALEISDFEDFQDVASLLKAAGL